MFRVFCFVLNIIGVVCDIKGRGVQRSIHPPVSIIEMNLDSIVLVLLFLVVKTSKHMAQQKPNKPAFFHPFSLI